MPVTHYIPAFTQSYVSNGRTVMERAICGTYHTWDEIAPAESEPTCEYCRQYLELDPAPTGGPHEAHPDDARV